VNAGASSCWLEGKAKTPAGTAGQMRARRKQQRSNKQSRLCIQIVCL